MQDSTSLRSRLASLIWRLLSLYGQIKYRYLLPFYSALGISPAQRKPSGTASPSATLRSAQALSTLLNRTSYSDQLNAINQRVKERKGAVIFLPSVGWEIANTQRTNHMAREFAKQGYVAIFDSTNSFDDVNGFKEIEPNLFLFRGPDKILSEIARPILWAYTYNFDRTGAYGSSARTVYDWIDDLDVFQFDRTFLEKTHARALKEAHVVMSVARCLHERAVTARPDALYVPNGVDYDHFAGKAIETLDDSDIEPAWLKGRPLAGYYGAMAEWFDYDLLDAVATLRPDWNFLLIGPMFDNSLSERGRSLLKHSNVRWIGPRDYQKLPGYLQLFDAATIPFAINDITLATSPLKLFEYFAGGKPVIATPMPECAAFPEVHIARNTEEFSAALDRALIEGQDVRFRESLHTLGRENSWAARVQLVLEHLEDKKRSSVGERRG
jgi:glycosyltransferase involved in cell wall biosynthesis